jgi:serine/threonine protein kinase
VVINRSVEEKLLGSAALQDNRYTQIWFDILTSRHDTRRQAGLSPGASLKEGTYKVEARICSGGQATTYRGINSLGQSCVLKEFVLPTSDDSTVLIESARQFEAEVTLLAQLDHPGIVKLEDFFYEDGRLYVVLEYIEGRSLRQTVQEDGALPEQEVLRIAQQVTAIIEYLHGCNPPVVHRDITPENLLIDKKAR